MSASSLASYCPNRSAIGSAALLAAATMDDGNYQIHETRPVEEVSVQLHSPPFIVIETTGIAQNATSPAYSLFTRQCSCALTLPDPSQQAVESLLFELHRAGGGDVHVRWAEHNAGVEVHHAATDDEALLLCPPVIRQLRMRRPSSYTHLIVLMRLAVGWLLLGCSEIFRTLRAYLGLNAAGSMNVMQHRSSPVTNHGDIHPRRFLLLLCEKGNPQHEYTCSNGVPLERPAQLAGLRIRPFPSSAEQSGNFWTTELELKVISALILYIFISMTQADRAFVVMVLEASCMAKVNCDMESSIYLSELGGEETSLVYPRVHGKIEEWV
uniref:Uncharacterized protein n=1 Tax=Aegilops tauschii TaxID=37682 RepID=M8C729_AEGTA